MRMTAILLGTALVVFPSLAMAQQQTCEQRAAIMGQLIEDMGRARAVVSAAEVEAASLKVQVKALQEQIKGLQAEAEKVAAKVRTKSEPK